MPTYEYACKSCGQHLEVVQSFKDDSLTTCAACGGPLRKVFGSIGIAFKGSGFYRNDSRQAAPSGKASSDKASSDKSSDTGSSDKAASGSGSGSSSDVKSTPDGSKSDSKAASSGA
ncbi:MAG TPA: FmdB family zinc ribbon protein [Acidimicrobiales bacterium]|nr:FmdB family zinc ribbon protein [Acidimicrobiales bacterium]